MSINNVSSFWGKDYAAEFKEKTDASMQEINTKLAKTGVAIPIIQRLKKDDQKGIAIDRQLVTKEQVEKAEEKTKKDFLQYGASDGKKVNEKDAEKMAKNYVENEQHKERVQGTQVYMDKDAYKKAEKERKEERKDLVKQYREQGLSRKEAKQKADSQLVENEYLSKNWLFGQRKTREFVENNRNTFYDENGNFSSDKFKQKAVEYANQNTDTENGEVTNYHLSLKERRAAAEKEGVDANVIKNIAKKSNLDYEKDDTNLYRTLVIGGFTGLGAGAGAIFGSSTAAAASSAASAATGAGAAAASDSAGAGAASANGTGAGAVAGFAVGTALSTLIRDNGKTEDRIYKPGEEQSHQPTPPSNPDQVPPQSNPDKPGANPTKPDIDNEEECPEYFWESEYCDHEVKKGEYWSNIIEGTMTVNGKKPAGNVLKALIHAEKLKHGITDFKLNTSPAAGQTMRLYTDFSDLLEDDAVMKKCPELKYLKDADIQIDCDGKVAKGNSSGKPKVKYTRYNGAAGDVTCFSQNCNQNLPVRISREEFNRKQQEQANQNK